MSCAHRVFSNARVKVFTKIETWRRFKSLYEIGSRGQSHQSLRDHARCKTSETSETNSNVETLIHLLKCSLGTGVLAIPQAFGRAGLATGIVGTIVCGLLMTHGLRILISSRYETCKIKRVPILTYPESITVAIKHGPKALHSFAPMLACLVDIFLVTYQLGGCCVYIVFVAENIKKLYDPIQVISLEMHMMIILLPLVVFNLIPSLKLLAPFSLLANLITFLGLFIVMYYMLSTTKNEEVAAAPIEYTGPLSTFPLFVGTVLFALTSVPVVVSLEMNMKTPKDFGTPFGVLNIGMFIIITLYVVFGIIGYLFCKSQCSDSITLDLPPGTLAAVVQIMMVVAIFISYGLHCYVPVEVLWFGYVLPRLQKAEFKHTAIGLYVFRVILCLFTFIVAICVPRLGLFISLFGALCLASLGLCFPPLMDMCVKYPDRLGPGRILMYVDIILAIIGFLGLVAGTYVALLNIVLTFM